MSTSRGDAFCAALIDGTRYPIDRPQDPQRHAAIERAHAALARDGCAVLNGFLSRAGLERLLSEVHARRPQAYFSPDARANVYFSEDDPGLPADHPRRIFMPRSNGFITSDLFGPASAARRLYDWPPLARFVAECLGKEQLYIYADPVSNMIVNVGKPGSCFNWHFDTNEFTITLALQPADSGGHFEYVPDLRSRDDERYADVRAVLGGDRARVVQLDLCPGDLQLFLGRFALHRVTANTGARDRLVLIMSFTERPGMIGSAHRSRQLYGKISDAHTDGAGGRVRNDALMD